jgi:hypothetical protein
VAVEGAGPGLMAQSTLAEAGAAGAAGATSAEDCYFQIVEGSHCTNGLFVNDVKIDNRILQHGDIIQFGGVSVSDIVVLPDLIITIVCRNNLSGQ